MQVLFVILAFYGVSTRNSKVFLVELVRYVPAKRKQRAVFPLLYYMQD